MSGIDEKKLDVVRDYHERSKHRLNRYAASLGYMDWANQPDPFRTFAETQQIDLAHPQLHERPTYDELFSSTIDSAKLDADWIGRLFYHSLALSAWKQAAQTSRWSLRINPSSGALHPTEGYLISGCVPGLFEHAGVFHYAPFRHRLERRFQFSVSQWEALSEGLPQPCLLLGLTSIYWRESWKYGERAFRYCHHDVGHAIGAIAFSARILGWYTRLVDTMADEDLNRLLGTSLQDGIEAEHADCLLVLSPKDGTGMQRSFPEFSAEEWRRRIPDATCTGTPNRLSGDHHAWPVIDDVSLATRNSPSEHIGIHTHAQSRPLTSGQLMNRKHAAEKVIRQRRSAVDMDGTTLIKRDTFYHMLQRTLPTQFPFKGLPWAPKVSLAIFVHRITGLEPGLYLFVREASHETSLRGSLKTDFEWYTPEGTGRGLRLYRLLSGDARHAAKLVSCHQDIAGDSCFSLGMLAEFETTLSQGGASFYPRLFWETGLLGQILYLEAEAAGVRGTGIGCFFDDTMHELLGITDRSWQSLYHFTVGGPVEDPRLKTMPPYAHTMSKA